MNKTTSGRGARDDARVCVVSVVCKYVMSEGFDRVRMNDVWDRKYRTIAWVDRDAISTQLDPPATRIELTDATRWKSQPRAVWMQRDVRFREVP